MSNEKKRFKKGDVIAIGDRAALITKVGGDGTTADTSTVNYSFIESDGGLGGGHYFRGEYEMAEVKKIDFAKVRTVVDLPPEWQKLAVAYEQKTKATADARAEVLGEWAPETHPSYGYVQVSRVSGHTSLFGSPFKHQHYMTLTVGRSSRQRSHGRDWHFGGVRGGLVEIALSEAQWAHMVSSVGMGGGVPCTLQYVGGQRQDSCPEQEEVERFHDDIEKDAKQAMKFMDVAMAKMKALIDDKAPSKEKRKEVLEALSTAQRKMNDSAPFMVKQLAEHMETVVQAAKTEVEAYVHATIVESGIQKLAEVNGRGSPLSFPEPKKQDERLVEGVKKGDEEAVKTESEKVTIHLVAAIAYDGKAEIKRRALVYNRVKSMLIATESNDERDAPLGLKRIRSSDLPKVGGLLGTTVAALTEAEGNEVLRRLLEARQNKAQAEVNSMKAALELLPKE